MGTVVRRTLCATTVGAIMFTLTCGFAYADDNNVQFCRGDRDGVTAVDTDKRVRDASANQVDLCPRRELPIPQFRYLPNADGGSQGGSSVRNT